MMARGDDTPSEPSAADSLSQRIDPEHGPTRLGRYVLLRELGRGAIGVVYAAYHEGLDRKLAIKLLNRSRAGRRDLEARLRREARALAKLSHPNVVQVYDVGELEGRVYVVMEFVEGQTLTQWMKQTRELDETLALFADAGRGLAAAHAAGVVHRDFKPDNVIVGVDGRPRILDFGLARGLQTEDAPSARERESSAEIALARRLVAADERDTSIGPTAANLRDLDPGGTLDGSEFEGEVRELGQRRQVLESRDEGNLARDLRTRDPNQTADPGETIDGDEFEITVRSAPGRAVLGDDVLTRTGAMMGTPAYMSPEQFAAGPIGQASDQFSFCVALHEAVYGLRPYTARTQADLRIQVREGTIIDAPPQTTVPEWLREVILRGLDPDPDKRWPSMDELIAALEPAPKDSSPSRWTIALAVVAVVAAAVGVGVAMQPREPPCPDLDAASAQLWTDARGAELAEAFAGSGSSYAGSAWVSVEARLSSWVERWATQQVETCETARQQRSEGEGTTLLIDRRQACLDRNRRAFTALTEQFAEADETVVERAVEAAAALPEPARCGDLGALEAGVEAPPSAVATVVAELRNHLAELDTRQATGRWKSGLPLAMAAVERSRVTAYGPVIAEALLTHGRLLAQSGGASAAEDAVERLQEALDEADRSGHHELVPQIATELVSLSIYAKPDPIRGRLWARRALTGLDRLARASGDVDGELGRELGLARARGIWALGNLERLDGDNERAELLLREALELLETHAPAHPERGIMLNDLGNVLADRGDVDAAREAYSRALRESLEAFGEGHPRVGNTHFNLARLAYSQGDLETAHAEADEAFIIYAAARGLEHRDVGAVEIIRAAIELGEGEVDAARERARKAQTIYDAVLAHDNIDRAEPHQMLGHIAFALGEYDEAAAEYRAALAIKRAALPRGHIELVSTLTNLGLVQLTRGEKAVAAGEEQAARVAFAAAVGPIEQAIELLEGGEGVDPERIREHRLYFGDALLRRAAEGDAERASAVFEVALAGCRSNAQLCGTIALKAGQAWAKRGDATKARALAAEARARLETVDGDVSALLAQADELLH